MVFAKASEEIPKACETRKEKKGVGDSVCRAGISKTG